MRSSARLLLALCALFGSLSSAFAFEVEVGSEVRRAQYWQRESLIKGRDLDYREQEFSQWGLMGFSLGGHHFSARGEERRLEGYNRQDDQLQSQTTQVVIPRWDYRDRNLNISLWRVIETPVEAGGSYSKAWSEPEVYERDFVQIKLEENREFFEFNSGVDMERELAESDQILRRHYQWYEFAMGAYNKNLKGWRLYARQRREEFPEVLSGQEYNLGGFEYYDKKPVEPRPEAYWKQFRFAVDRIALDETLGVQAKIESDFSFVAFESQQILSFSFIGRSLKPTYDDSWTNPSRVENETVQLIQSYEYRGQTQLWGSPFLLKWLLRYQDAPVLADYRQDLARISLAFDY